MHWVKARQKKASAYPGFWLMAFVKSSRAHSSLPARRCEQPRRKYRIAWSGASAQRFWLAALQWFARVLLNRLSRKGCWKKLLALWIQLETNSPASPPPDISSSQDGAAIFVVWCAGILEPGALEIPQKCVVMSCLVFLPVLMPPSSVWKGKNSWVMSYTLYLHRLIESQKVLKGNTSASHDQSASGVQSETVRLRHRLPRPSPKSFEWQRATGQHPFGSHCHC